MNPKIEELTQRVQEAVRLLQEYEGEKIVAGEHPIYKAIVRIECLCRQRNRAGAGRQMYALPSPINMVWISLLDASREPKGLLKRRRSLQGFDMDGLLPKNKKRRAKLLAAMLASALWGGINMLLLHEKAGGDLPYVPDYLRKPPETPEDRF